MLDDWAVRISPVASDGSCFFSSVAIALNESLEAWRHNKKISKKLRNHWHSFLELGLESPDNFTPKFVRYITSASIDDKDLVMYNDTARADKTDTFDSVDDLAEHVLHSNCWVDTTTFGAFLKSLDYSIALVVLDYEIKQPLNMFEELTKNKDFYICLWLEDDHYQPIQTVYKNKDLSMCVSRDCIIQFMRDCYPDHLQRF